MMERRRGVTVVAVLLAVTMSACGGGGSSLTSPTGSTPTATTPGGPLVFRASPIDLAAIRWITPLGNLNPPAHALPTDHIYFYFANPDAGEQPEARRTSFFAPADGTITDVFTSATIPDVKVFVRVSATTSYYIDHLIPDAPITRGMTLTAGQRLGTSGSAYGIDLGVVNSSLTLGFVNPLRYTNSDSLHADAPLKYYEEPLKSTLYAMVQRIGSERDGRIDFDVAGRLSGNWFSEFGSFPLAFVYDTYDPSQVRLSIIGLAQTGVFAIGAAEPLPRDVSVATGPVRYTLTRAITGPRPPSGPPMGRLLVQMSSDQRIRAEVFPPTASADAFTSAATNFIR